MNKVPGDDPIKKFCHKWTDYLYLNYFITLLKMFQLGKGRLAYYKEWEIYPNTFTHNRTTCNRHLCRKMTVLSYHRCLINTGVEKINNILIYIIILTARCLSVKGNFGIPTTVFVFQSVLFNCLMGWILFINCIHPFCKLDHKISMKIFWATQIGTDYKEEGE